MYAISQITNTRILAEGVETLGELETLRNIGLRLFQGYLFARPEAAPKDINMSRFMSRRDQENKEIQVARQLISNQTSIQYHLPVQHIIKQLQNNPDLNSIAVVDGTQPIGMIHRKRFLTQMSRQYVMDLATHKTIADFMDTEFLQIDANFRLEQVSKLVTNRARIHAEEDFVICEKGEFLGCGQVIDLLRQITEIQISTARHANPLTLLPGNVPIGDCVNRLLKDGKEFVISYLDLNHFKPFNDRYGYAKGDQVLLLLSDLLQQYLNVHEGDFVGHVGGDDFIAVSLDGEWMNRIFPVLDAFSREVIKFYDDQDLLRGGIEASDRFGVCHFYDFIGVSVGAKRVDPKLFHSFMEVSKELAQVKQLAKHQDHGDIVFDNGDTVELLSKRYQKRLIQPIQSSVYLNDERVSVSF
jgi:GGDEF domain-containing protein/predicted transcriptional regulator